MTRPIAIPNFIEINRQFDKQALLMAMTPALWESSYPPIQTPQYGKFQH